MLPDHVVATYEAASGLTLGHLRWHMAYAAIRHGVIMRRVTERSVAFGEAERPEDVDDMIHHRATLEAKLAQVAAEPDQPEVHLRPNKLVEYKTVAMIMASAQRLGVTKIGLVGNEQFMN